MNRLLYILPLALILLTACSEEELVGEGTLALTLKMGTDVTNVASTRVLPSLDELNASCELNIRNGEGGLLRTYQGLNSVPSELQLVTGSYSVSATAGMKIDAAFDAPYYKGAVDFSIVRNQVTSITLPLYLQNTVVETVYTAAAAAKFESSKVKVVMSKGALEFDKAQSGQIGYFILPTGETELDWSMEAMTVDKIAYQKKGVLSNVKAATKYTLTFDYGELEPEDGGAAIIVKVAEEPIAKAWDIEIAKCPSIERYDLDAKQYLALSEPMNFRKDDSGRDVEVYVRTTSELKSLSLTCQAFSSILGLGFTSFDIQTMADNVRKSIESKGISFLNSYDVEKDCTTAKVSFASSFFKMLSVEEGEYNIQFLATDKNGKYTSATLRILVSNAIITTEMIDDYTVWTNRATLKANVNVELYEQAENKEIGFQYRRKGVEGEEWTSIAAASVEGSSLVMDIAGLEPDTRYEYRAYAAGQSADAQINTFITEAAEQMPNSGFEEWCQPGKPLLLYKDGGEMFWDSGNWGSTTLSASDNVTTYDESVVAPGSSGKRSVKMKSAFVGLGTIGKFAAGNAFVGKYIKTIGTSGAQIGFGRPFTSRPTKLVGHLRYEMHNVTHSSLSDVPKGAADNAHIYISIGDWEEDNTGDKNVPFLVDTSAKKFFDKTGKGVIAYGEEICESSTEGTGMIPFEIELNYRDLNRKPKYLILVASASRYGDYFTGGEGSTLWLDDLELVYE